MLFLVSNNTYEILFFLSELQGFAGGNWVYNERLFLDFSLR